MRVRVRVCVFVRACMRHGLPLRVVKKIGTDTNRETHARDFNSDSHFQKIGFFPVPFFGHSFATVTRSEMTETRFYSSQRDEQNEIYIISEGSGDPKLQLFKDVSH